MPRTTASLPIVASLLVALAAAAPPAAAQEADPEAHATAVTVRILNGTTGQAGDASSVELREIGFAMRLLASASYVAGEVVFPSVELYNFRPYLAVVVREGVAYRAQLMGAAILAGTAFTVPVFDQTSTTGGVTIKAMDVVARRQPSGCELEYILTVENGSRPQRTVAADAVPVQLTLPPGSEDLSAEVYRGPEPEPAPVAAAAGGVGPRAALPPGLTRLVLRAYWPAAASAELPVAASLPVGSWSLLVAPASLPVTAPQLTRDDGEYPGFSRWRGPALAPGQVVTATLPPLPENAGALASGTAPSERRARAQTAESTDSWRTGWTWGAALLAALGLLLLVLRRRRRG